MSFTHEATRGSTNLTMDQILPDFPSGPLDEYRKRASFDWKKLKILLETEEVIRFKHHVWSRFESDPVFHQNPWDEPTRHDERRLTFLRVKRLFEYNFATEEDMIASPLLIPAFIQCLAQYDASLAAKKFMSLDVFVQAARATGSRSHLEVIEKVKNFDILGALSITELSHGSNINGIRTRATFDASTQEFILHTPELEATKVWSGILGTSATHAVVFALLYTPDGVCHGVHQFLTPVRDPKTLLPYPGVRVGDMGWKLGMNGNDNGWMQFTQYRIPKASHMNKHTQMMEDGKLIEKKKMDKKQKQGIALGVLSMGRISIVYLGILHLQSALTIAIRYSAVRRQFGSSKDQPEWPVIEYQTQQYRLFPYLAASYVLKHFYHTIQKDFITFYADIAYGFRLIPASEQANLGSEIHALTSSSKPLVSWIARNGIQECRECCGGHGYLRAAGIGKLRDDHDPNMTHEGECYVMLMQTSNYLIKLIQEKKRDPKGYTIKAPLHSVDFLDSYEKRLSDKMIHKDFNQISAVINAYDYLVCYLLIESNERLEQMNVTFNGDAYAAKSNSQIFFLQSLATVYFEGESIKRFHNYLTSGDDDIPAEIMIVLERLLLLYGLWLLEKHLSTLYEGDYFPPRYQLNPTRTIREIILRLCAELKDDAVSLVDTISPPDFILNSCLGFSDGKVYEHIFEALSKSKDSEKRPEWFEEFTTHKPNISSLRGNVTPDPSSSTSKL